MGGNRWIVSRHDIRRMDRRTLPQPICDRVCPGLSWRATVLAVVSASRLALVLSLVPFGFFNGLIDVSMNSQAAAFEQRTGRSVMSSFHAFYSLGGLLGTLFGAALLAANIPPLTHVLVAAIPFIVAGCFMHRGLIPEKKQDHPHGFFLSIPSGKVVPLAVMAFVFFLTEGAIYDWSGVFLRTELGVDLAAASIGYAAFSLLMASIRFCGDFWVARFGRLPVFLAGTIVGAAGLMLACLGRKLSGFRRRFRLGRRRVSELCAADFFGRGAAERYGLWQRNRRGGLRRLFRLFRRTAADWVDCSRIGLQKALLLVAVALMLTLFLARVGLEHERDPSGK